LEAPQEKREESTVHRLGSIRQLVQSGDKSEGGCFEHDARTGKLIAHRGIARPP
jgi:hypothetical protein